MAPPLPRPIYGGVDVCAFGALRPQAVPAGQRGAAICLHSWHADDTLGRNVTIGCIGLTRSGQQPQILVFRRPDLALGRPDSEHTGGAVPCWDGPTGGGAGCQAE